MTSNLFRSMGIAVLAAAVFAAPASAQTAAKAESLTGVWNMSLIGDHVIPVAFVLEQSGTALKGTFTLMGKDFPLAGEFVGGTLTLKGKGPAFGRPQPAGGGDHNAAVAAGGGAKPSTNQVAGPNNPNANPALADMTITGTPNADGVLEGTIAIKMAEGTGMIKWSAERFKERKVPETQAVSTVNLNIDGAWKMTIPEAQQMLDVEFKNTDGKVTGIAKNDHLGTLTLEGTLAAGTLSFVATGEAMGQQVKIEFTGKYTKAGTFAGDAQSQMGALTWTAERVKK